MLIDSHAHLEIGDFDNDMDDVVERARQTGIDLIVTVGTNLSDCKKAVDLTRRYEAVYAAVGIHPHEVKDITPTTYDDLRKLTKMQKVVAYGEIGLDFFRNLSPRDIQLRRFAEQLELAADLELPIIIHDREAHSETLELLKTWKGRRGIIHCFSGDCRMAEKCLDMGFYISIPGPVTYKKSEILQDVVRFVPITSLLLETDAPYLTPEPNRGKRNEPAFVIHTAKKVAEIKELPLDTVAFITSQNAKDVFGIA